MNREEAPGKSPEEMYIQQKVRVLLMLKKMGSNVSQTTKQYVCENIAFSHVTEQVMELQVGQSNFCLTCYENKHLVS